MLLAGLVCSCFRRRLVSLRLVALDCSDRPGLRFWAFSDAVALCPVHPFAFKFAFSPLAIPALLLCDPLALPLCWDYACLAHSRRFDSASLNESRCIGLYYFPVATWSSSQPLPLDSKSKSISLPQTPFQTVRLGQLPISTVNSQSHHPLRTASSRFIRCCCPSGNPLRLPLYPPYSGLKPSADLP